MKARDSGFIITNHLQHLEVWSAIGRGGDRSPDEINALAARYAAAILVPVCGNAVQRWGTTGFEPDGAMLQIASFKFRARAQLRKAVITGWIPEYFLSDIDVTVECGARSVTASYPAASFFEITLPLDVEEGSEHELLIALERPAVPAASKPGSADTRHLGCIIESVEFL